MARVTVNDLGAVGLVTDRQAHAIPPNAWDMMNNVRCKNGAIEPIDGYSDVTSESHAGSTEPVRYHGIVKVQNGSTVTAVCPYDSDDDGDANKIYSFASGTWTGVDRTRASGDYAGSGVQWNGCAFNGVAILNNGHDAPQYTNGVSACADLPWDATTVWSPSSGAGLKQYKAKVIRPFLNYLFALNITDGSTEYPNMVHWSDPADPGAVPATWDYTLTTTDAGRTVLADTGGYVLDACQLGDQLFIYKEDATYRASLVGGNFVFDLDPVFGTRGIYATDCVIDIGQRHAVLGDSVFYVHSGGEPVDVLTGRAASALFDNINPSFHYRTFLAHNPTENEVWICYPDRDSEWPNRALIWNYHDNTFYPRDLPQCSGMVTTVVTGSSSGVTWNDLGGTWDAITGWNHGGAWDATTYSPIGDTLVAATDQLTQFADGRTSDDVVALKTGIHPGAPDDLSMLRRVMPHAKGDAFTVSVGTQHDIDGPYGFKTVKSFSPGSDHKIDTRCTSRNFVLQISGSGDWSMSGVTFDAVQAGRR